MKTIFFLIVIVLFGIWLFQKNGMEVFKPLPQIENETSSFGGSTSSSKSLQDFSLLDIGAKIQTWTKDVSVFGGFTKSTSSPLKENFSTQLVSFDFPQSYKIRSIREATIDVGIGESFCSTTLKTGEQMQNQGQKNIAGLNANKYTWGDAAAGNQYQGTVYSYKQKDTCYAISLFLHTNTPENYAGSEDEAKQFRVEHDAAVKRIQDKFESIVDTLTVKK